MECDIVIFLWIETFPLGERRWAHKTQEINGTCKTHETSYKVNKITPKFIEAITIKGEKILQKAKLPEGSVGRWKDAAIVSCYPFEEGFSSVVVSFE